MNSTSPLRGRVIVATAAAAALALTGCTPSAQTSPESSAEDQTLTVWHYFSDDNQVAILEDYKSMFEEANPGVTVENVFVPYDQLNPRLISTAASSTGPDVVVFNGADMSSLALGGALAPLDEYWDGFADAGQFPDSVIHRLDDTVYAAQGYVNLLGLWYNADVLDEAGVEPPTSLDELDEALAAALEAGQGGITLSGLPNSQGEWQAYPWLTAFGFSYDDPQREPLVDAFSMVQSWTESGALTREASTWDQTVPFQTFAAGGHAFAENGNWPSSNTASCRCRSATMAASTWAVKVRPSARSASSPTWRGSTSRRPTSAKRAASSPPRPSAASRHERMRRSPMSSPPTRSSHRSPSRSPRTARTTRPRRFRRSRWRMCSWPSARPGAV